MNLHNGRSYRAMMLFNWVINVAVLKLVMPESYQI